MRSCIASARSRTEWMLPVARPDRTPSVTIRPHPANSGRFDPAYRKLLMEGSAWRIFVNSLTVTALRGGGFSVCTSPRRADRARGHKRADRISRSGSRSEKVVSLNQTQCGRHKCLAGWMFPCSGPLRTNPAEPPGWVPRVRRVAGAGSCHMPPALWTEEVEAPIGRKNQNRENEPNSQDASLLLTICYGVLAC